MSPTNLRERLLWPKKIHSIFFLRAIKMSLEFLLLRRAHIFSVWLEGICYNLRVFANIVLQEPISTSPRFFYFFSREIMQVVRDRTVASCQFVLSLPVLGWGCIGRCWLPPRRAKNKVALFDFSSCGWLRGEGEREGPMNPKRKEGIPTTQPDMEFSLKIIKFYGNLFPD